MEFGTTTTRRKRKNLNEKWKEMDVTLTTDSKVKIFKEEYNKVIEQFESPDQWRGKPRITCSIARTKDAELVRKSLAKRRIENASRAELRRIPFGVLHACNMSIEEFLIELEGKLGREAKQRTFHILHSTRFDNMVQVLWRRRRKMKRKKNFGTVVRGGANGRREKNDELCNANYSEEEEKVDRNWLMMHFGTNIGDYGLHHADFLSEQIPDFITKGASVVFMNNHSFNCELMLLKMKNNVRVVTIAPIYSSGCEWLNTDTMVKLLQQFE
ncbi:hypothetical protein CAEBREN_04276 [Caenorhabditis brenneri]|uniref:DOT1 domain-containing protein n=1 Tax=Caenorhabditis brenneri TaxID=135651 RepID=G0NB02_CAEBE|nr:hypothetical protein CAEBREN_04276 [Caenorhabditis brenneri]